jgi:hypothetical protein
MCPSAKDAPRDLREWHDAATRAYEARLRVLDNMTSQGLTPVYPSAYWALEETETGPVVSHTTGTGRMEIVAVEGGVTISVYAGPDWSREALAGQFVREPDGRYRWERGSEPVPVRSLGPAIEWGERPGDGEPGDVVVLWWSERGVAYTRGISRSGRLIVVAGLDENGPFCEWVAPDLVFGEGRPDRLADLFHLDDRVFGGALAAADTTGQLARARELLASAQSV